jgi:uncharacterized DUF497 family protein
MFDLEEPGEFDWDQGNTVKNLIKHNVSCQESEEVFFDESQVILDDERHFGSEKRKLIIGKTNAGILLSVVFTVRNNKIRVISARMASKKERKLYEK